MGAGAILGWTFSQGVAVGCIISVASTMVLMRLLIDRGESSSEAGRVMITLTLVEDLAVVILTVLLPSLGSNGGTDYVQVVWKIGKALLILIPVVFAGWKVVPRFSGVWKEPAAMSSLYYLHSQFAWWSPQ
jgi:CPA2 family monovalent cation:H+ antiporter-2